MTTAIEQAKQDRTPVRVTVGQGIVIETSDELKRFASFIIDNRLAPPSYETPQQVFVGIAAGMAHGFNPLQALQAVAVIRQRPCIWGDALPALVNRSGKCQYVKESFMGEGDDLSAVCEVKRHDQDEPTLRTFSVADAKAAGLWGKAGPWKSYPKRMLQMRARAWAFRDGFADVLAGFGVAEEVNDYQPTGREPFDPETAGIVHADNDPLLIEAVGESRDAEGED